MARSSCAGSVPWLGLPLVLVALAAALGCYTLRSAPGVRDLVARLTPPGEFVGPYDTQEEALCGASAGKDWSAVAREENCCFIISQDDSGYNAARMPLKGGETVLDAVSQVPWQPSQTDFWIVRSPMDAAQPEYVLGVDFEAITRGSMATNYPLIRGDRVFIPKKAEHCVGNSCMCRPARPKPLWRWW